MTNLKMTTALLALIAAPAFAENHVVSDGSDTMRKPDVSMTAPADADEQPLKKTVAEASGAPEADAALEDGVETAVENSTMRSAGEDTDTDPTPAPVYMSADADFRMPQFQIADIDTDGYRTVSADAVTADELPGLPLYDASDNWIGEVDNVVYDENGEIAGAVLGVGGFLGVGEKDVLVSFDSLSIRQETDGDERRVYVDVTKQQLEDLPSFTQ